MDALVGLVEKTRGGRNNGRRVSLGDVILGHALCYRCRSRLTWESKEDHDRYRNCVRGV